MLKQDYHFVSIPTNALYILSRLQFDLTQADLNNAVTAICNRIDSQQQLRIDEKTVRDTSSIDQLEEAVIGLQAKFELIKEDTGFVRAHQAITLSRLDELEQEIVYSQVLTGNKQEENKHMTPQPSRRFSPMGVQQKPNQNQNQAPSMSGLNVELNVEMPNGNPSKPEKEGKNLPSDHRRKENFYSKNEGRPLNPLEFQTQIFTNGQKASLPPKANQGPKHLKVPKSLGPTEKVIPGLHTDQKPSDIRPEVLTSKLQKRLIPNKNDPHNPTVESKWVMTSSQEESLKQPPWKPGQWQKANYQPRPGGTSQTSGGGLQRKKVKEKNRCDKEILFFGIEETKYINKDQYQVELLGRVVAVLGEISSTHLGAEGYNIKSGDIVHVKTIHSWTGNEPHNPIIAEFKDEETANKAKRAIKRAGFYKRRTHSQYGKFKKTGNDKLDRGNRKLIEEMSFLYARPSTTKDVRDERKAKKEERKTEEFQWDSDFREYEKNRRVDASSYDFKVGENGVEIIKKVVKSTQDLTGSKNKNGNKNKHKHSNHLGTGTGNGRARNARNENDAKKGDDGRKEEKWKGNEKDRRNDRDERVEDDQSIHGGYGDPDTPEVNPECDPEVDPDADYISTLDDQKFVNNFLSNNNINYYGTLYSGSPHMQARVHEPVIDGNGNILQTGMYVNTWRESPLENDPEVGKTTDTGVVLVTDVQNEENADGRTAPSNGDVTRTAGTHLEETEMKTKKVSGDEETYVFADGRTAPPNGDVTRTAGTHLEETEMKTKELSEDEEAYDPADERVENYADYNEMIDDINESLEPAASEEGNCSFFEDEDSGDSGDSGVGTQSPNLRDPEIAAGLTTERDVVDGKERSEKGVLEDALEGKVFKEDTQEEVQEDVQEEVQEDVEEEAELKTKTDGRTAPPNGDVTRTAGTRLEETEVKTEEVSEDGGAFDPAEETLGSFDGFDTLEDEDEFQSKERDQELAKLAKLSKLEAEVKAKLEYQFEKTNKKEAETADDDTPGETVTVLDGPAATTPKASPSTTRTRSTTKGSGLLKNVKKGPKNV